MNLNKLNTQAKLLIHGGAESFRNKQLSPKLERAYLQALNKALKTGYKILANDGSSLEAVTQAVISLENCPLFNAGTGSVLTQKGAVECDAAIMDGCNLKAGAVAGVSHIKNPVLLAKLIMEKSRHVLLIGKHAERYAHKQGMVLIDTNELITEEQYTRWLQLKQKVAIEKQEYQEIMVSQKRSLKREASSKIARQNKKTTTEKAQLKAKRATENIKMKEIIIREKSQHKEKNLRKNTRNKYGTVGAVALDRAGHLAAATSTGGIMNKAPGRVGDSPIIGAGTYANNNTCAVSGTGEGEYFMRLLLSYDLAAQMQYQKISLDDAAIASIKKLTDLGGKGGLIAIDRFGNAVMRFNTDAMYRGMIDIDHVFTAISSECV